METIHTDQSWPDLVGLLGAAERLRLRQPDRRDAMQWMILAEMARDALAGPIFQPLPLTGFSHKSGKKERLITVVPPRDHLIEEALLPLLERRLVPLLSDHVHSFRRGRSAYSAAEAAAALLGKGLRHVLLADIHAFFPSIDRDVLRRILGESLPPKVVDVCIALTGAPIRWQGTLRRDPTGLPLGRPISPILSNSYLASVDRAMTAAAPGYLRYADDLFIATADEADLAACESVLRTELAALHLCLNEEKSRRYLYDGRPIPYMGQMIDERGVYERITGLRKERRLQNMARRANESRDDGQGAQAVNRRTQTLYVTEDSSYCKVEQGIIVVMRGKEVVREIPLHRLDRVVIMAGASCSSGFMAACIGENIPVLFFVGKGRAYGSLVAGGMPNPLRLRGQYELLSNEEHRLALAKSIIGAKIDAQLARVRYIKAFEKERALLGRLRDKLARLHNVRSVRGYEGAATKVYYTGFARRIKREEFAFTVRSKRPPRDRINSLMSFTYSLLFGEMQTALLAHGLDPHPGLVHELERNHPALASDLIEPYRCLLGDSFVLQLVNNDLVTAEDFQTQPNSAVYLTRDGRRQFLHRYETFMRAPLNSDGATPRGLLERAALAMLAVVMKETDQLVLPFTYQDQDREDDHEQEDVQEGTPESEEGGAI